MRTILFLEFSLGALDYDFAFSVNKSFVGDQKKKKDFKMWPVLIN